MRNHLHTEVVWSHSMACIQTRKPELDLIAGIPEIWVFVGILGLHDLTAETVHGASPDGRLRLA